MACNHKFKEIEDYEVKAVFFFISRTYRCKILQCERCGIQRELRFSCRLDDKYEQCINGGKGE